MIMNCQCSTILGRLDYPSEKICTTYIHFNADAANIEIRADYYNWKLAHNVDVRRKIKECLPFMKVDNFFICGF